MISRFRKHIDSRLAIRLAVSTAILTCIGGLAQAQVATRTQLSTDQDQGVLSLTAKVADVEGNPLSEGSVSFETANGSLSSVFVQNGEAVLHLANPPAWAKTVSAVYHGDAAYANSSATAAVSPAQSSTLPGFTVTANPSSVSVTPGEYATITLTVTSQNGFAEAVNLSCSGVPGASTCNFNPVVLTPPANGTVTSAMQLTTEQTSGVTRLQQPAGPFGKSGEALAIVFPGVLALAGLGALRRKNYKALRVLGLAMLLTAGSLGLGACNARYSYLHYKPSPNYGTPAGTYTIVVSAYSTNGTAITNATSTDSGCSGATCIALTVQ